MAIVATAEPVSALAQDGHGSHEILMYTDQVNRTDPMPAISTLVSDIKAKKAQLEALKAALEKDQQILVDQMKQSGETKIATDHGTVILCKGRRTVVVTDPALKAEIKLIEERGVRTGRCEERIGRQYCMIR